MTTSALSISVSSPVDGAGNWSVNLTGLSAGSHTIEAEVVDLERVVVPTSDSGLAIFDFEGNKLVPNIDLGQFGGEPSYTIAVGNAKAYAAIAYYCDGEFVYDEDLFMEVCSGNENYAIAVIDLETNALDGYIAIPPGLSTQASVLLFNEANNYLYVIGQDNNGAELVTIDTDTDTVIDSDAVPSAFGSDDIGSSAYLSADGSTLIIGNGSDNTVAIFDTASGTMGSYIEACTAALTDVVILPDNSKAYISCGQDDYVAVLDLDPETVTTTIATSDRASRLAMKADGSRIYVNHDFSVSDIVTINTATDTTIHTETGNDYVYELIANNAGDRLYAFSYVGLATNLSRIEEFDISGSTPVSLGTTNVGTSWTYPTDGDYNMPDYPYAPLFNSMAISSDDSLLVIPGVDFTDTTFFSTADSTFANVDTGANARVRGDYLLSGSETDSITITVAADDSDDDPVIDDGEEEQDEEASVQSSSEGTLADTGSELQRIVIVAGMLLLCGAVLLLRRFNVSRSR